MTTLSDLLANAPDQSAQDTGDTDEGGMLFIGEGKKYATQEEADKAIAFKEDHIQKIEEENATLRDAQQKAATLEDVLASIKQSSNNEQNSHQTGDEGNQDTPDIDALVAAAVQSNLQAATQSNLEQSNSQQVFDVLLAKYGNKASEVYSMKSAELGVDLDAMSKISPKAVLEYFKEAAAPSHGSGYQSGTYNTANLTSGTQDGVGTYAYWDKKIKSGDITREKGYQEQHKSLQAMGPAKFYGQS